MNPKQENLGISLNEVGCLASRHKGDMRFLVAQLGARMHYAIPRMLEAEGMLARFYTDICAVKGWPRLTRLVPPFLRPAGLRRLLGRRPTGVPVRKIHAFTAFGWEYVRRLAAARSSAEQTDAFLWGGKRFCELILSERQQGVTAVYTFNSAGLELLQAAKSKGIYRVMEQTIAPRRIEENLLAREHDCFPAWELPTRGDSRVEEFCTREQAEWQEAQVILCGSEFVKQSVVNCGGPVERCQVVPYGIDNRFKLMNRPPHNGPLRVLTVGAVNLRKGAPHVLEVARRLQGQLTFRMVGPIGVSPTAEAELRRAVELTGQVPRAEVTKHFAWADVFFLPSLCEGSATVTYEALASGLPVVCTPNTGSVVRDGIDGFVVPVRDIAAMAERLERLHHDRDLLEFASREARHRASGFTLEDYRRRLLQALYPTGAISIV